MKPPNGIKRAIKAIGIAMPLANNPAVGNSSLFGAYWPSVSKVRKPYFPHSGLSLVEILGAISILAVIASLSLTSVQDSLQSSQRSAVQRELQALNTALQNFKAAGGNIPPGTQAADAVQLLRQGTTMSGSMFSPLSGNVDMTKQIGGENYTLNYDDATGFSFDAEKDIAQVGESSPNEEGILAYPFDPSNPVATQDALQALQGLNPEDPTYQAYLEGLNAAFDLGTITADDLQQAGLVNANGTWIRPIFDITNPEAAFAVAQDLRDYRGDTEEYTARVASLNAALTALPSENQNTLNTALMAEFMSIAVSNRPAAATLADWSKINFSQGLQALYGINYLFQRTLTGLNVTGEQFNGLQAIVNSSLSGLNLEGVDFTNMELVNVNLSNTTGITGGDLNSAQVYTVVLSNVDMTGYDATGKNISRINFADTNLTIDMIKDAQKTNLSTTFTGTGITAQDLLDAGWTQDQLVNAKF
jgi:type II secretory pathway pseudopilin PulG/uncharacterized protein YjbI with pentapeptide repeats